MNFLKYSENLFFFSRLNFWDFAPEIKAEEAEGKKIDLLLFTKICEPDVMFKDTTHQISNPAIKVISSRSTEN